MKSVFTIACVAAAAFVCGATFMYLRQRESSSRWIAVLSDGGGFGMETAALNADIPWPGTTKPTGRVKFLNRDRGQQLGYTIKLPIKPNPTAVLPEKYRRTTKDANGLEFGPPEQVLYEGHFEFTLKDVDGFVLMKMDGPTEHLSAGSDNAVQGSTEQTVPTSVVNRTKKVDVSFVAVSCNPCQVN
jgi:hypothetical protein